MYDILFAGSLAVIFSFGIGFFMALGMAVASYIYPVTTKKQITYDNLENPNL